MSNSARVAIVGFGRFGRLHALALVQAGAKIVAIVDPSPHVLESASKTYPDAAVFPDVSSLLASIEVDAAVVASSELTHFQITLELISAGVPALVEKPVAATAEEAQQILNEARDGDVYIQSGFILRYEPRHLMLHEAVTSGRLGDLQLMRAKRDVSRSWFHAYGHTVNPVLETSIHDIDLALWLFDSSPAFVQAWGTNSLGYAIPESVTVLIEFASGGQAFVTSSWLRTDRDVPNILSWELESAQEDSGGVIAGDLEVLGSQGTSRLATYSDSFSLSTDSVTAYPDTAFWPVIGGRVWGALAAEAMDFHQAVIGGRTLGVASMEDAVIGQRVAEAAIVSLATGVKEPL